MGGYRRPPGIDGESPFEILFRIRPRLSFKPPHYASIASKSDLIPGFAMALVKSLRASRAVPYTPTKWPNVYEVVKAVYVRSDRKKPRSKIQAPAWYGPFIVKAEDHPRYTLHIDDRRRFRPPVYTRRLRLYVERQYGPEIAMCCWSRNFWLDDTE